MLTFLILQPKFLVVDELFAAFIWHVCCFDGTRKTRHSTFFYTHSLRIGKFCLPAGCVKKTFLPYNDCHAFQGFYGIVKVL